MRLIALTSDATRPSRRFRFAQYLPALAAAGFDVEERFAFVPSTTLERTPRAVRPIRLAGRMSRAVLHQVPNIRAARATDVALVLRTLVPGIPTLEPWLPRSLVVDVDDAVWLARPLGEAAARALARRARVITAGNEYLASWYRQHAGDVRVIPTSVDTDVFRPAPASSERFVVGWTGSRTTIPYLEAIEPALAAFLEGASDATLRVVSDVPPRFSTIASERVEWIAWTPADEVRAVQGMSVGLMPLPEDTAWNRGKCAFKMVQYLACGVPTIASPVGANRALLGAGEVGWAAASRDEWVDALRAAHRDRDRAATMGARGRDLVERGYSLRANAPRLVDALRDAARETRAAS